MALEAGQEKFVQEVENLRSGLKSQVVSGAQNILRSLLVLQKKINNNKDTYDATYGDSAVDATAADTNVDREIADVNKVLDAIFATSLVSQTREEMEQSVQPPI